MIQYFKIAFFLSAMLLQLGVIGQVQVTLQIPNLGSPYLSDYISNQSNRVLVLSNTTSQTREIYLRGKIEQLNAPGYYFRTKENYKPAVPIVLGPMETKTLFARSEDWAFIEEQHLEDNIPDREKLIIQSTGILPEGEYQVCVQAYDFNTDLPVSPDEPIGCQVFLVTLGSPPQLIMPACDDTITNVYPMISWAPAILLQALPAVQYDLYLVELVSEALNPSEVMEQSIMYKGGNPFVVENLRTTFYQVLPGDPPLKKGSRYAMCVVARDSKGSAVFENKGRSEICVIHVRDDIGIHDGPGSNVVASQPDAGDFQLPPISTLNGKLLYRFYGEGGIINHQGGLLSSIDPELMDLSGGQSIQNQGYDGINSSAQFMGLSGGPMPGQYGGMLPAVFNNSNYQQPPPPQYILPAGYNTTGGRPLKQARIRFTARYAVGKKVDIQHPEDLELIEGDGYPVRVTGSGVDGTLSFAQATKIIATTKTDNDGNYNVHFFADETFGMIESGPVEVHWGGKEFPASTTGYGFYRVITMEVEEKWYCHPDVIIFLQPGQALDVPVQAVTVQSYNLRVKVKANNKDLQYAGPGGPIKDAIVKVGRAKYQRDNAPACFPFNELKMEEYGHLLIPHPLNTNMVGDTGVTNINGEITFRRLLKHDGDHGCGEIFENGWPSDGYYLEAYSHPTIGDLNYGRNSINQVAPCGARLSSFCTANDCAPRSADYIPPTVEQQIELVPLFPKILANTRSIYNNVPYALPDATLILLVYHDNGDFKLQSYKTDQNGLFTKQFTTSDKPDLMRTNAAGAITTSYVMDYFKTGFRRKFCTDCGTLEQKKLLQFGQKWMIQPHLEPNSFVKGKVEDEHGQPIYGDVKIGDGPYLPLEMKYQLVQGANPNNAGSPYQLLGGIQANNIGSPGDLISQGGFNVEYQGGPVINPNFEQVSVFSQAAQSGQQVRIIIRPDASNYFADTFYVNIPSGHQPPGFDLGTFVIKERLHRPLVKVFHETLTIGGNGLPVPVDTPLEGAEVTLSNLPAQMTNAQGTTSFVFGSPSNEFRLRVYKEGYVQYDKYVTIPATKNPYEIEVDLDFGKELTGSVTRANGGQPLPGARVYTEIGSNNYGPIMVETITDQNGFYKLVGLPIGALTVKAAKTDTAVTYIGQSKNINTATTATLDFQLQEAPFTLAQIWHLPVDLESVTPSGNNWIINGAFVDLPANDRFRPENENQRLPFENITIKPTGPANEHGKLPVEPVANSILTKTTRFKSLLNDVHMVEMSGPPSAGGVSFIYHPNFLPVIINNVRIDKGDNDNGLVRTRTFSLLEYFRVSYNYDGQFYLGESPDNAVITAYKGTNDLSMPERYYLMAHDYGANQVSNPVFSVHNFEAYTERTESYVHQDTFVLATKLKVDLPLSNPDELIVSAGNVYVLPDKIIINEGDQPLEFDLETWHVKTGNWHFDQYQGGLVTSGIITTNLIEFPAPEILIKPTSLKLPTADDIDLDEITLGGVLDLDIDPLAKLTFDYVHSPMHDPGKGHWRIVLSHQQAGQTVAEISGLPGWPNQTVVGINFIENFSDGFEALTLAPNQTVNHYNVIQQTVSNIFISDGGVALSGNTDLDIPNLPGGSSASFVYYKEQNQIKLRVQGLVTNFETTGQVAFQGDQHHERIVLDWNHFEVTGGLTIYDDQSANEIHLRAKLIKEPNDIRIKIIDVDAGGELEGNIHQIIVLGGGQNGLKRVLQGEQKVAQQQWDYLGYQAQFEGFGGGFQNGEDVMWFKVVGALTNDASKGDEVKLANIETPFGDFALTMDFNEMALVGDLRVGNIPMGAVNIIEGVINMRMGGLGFYLVTHLRAIYPVIGELNTNFIVGSYPHLNADAQQILKEGMYIQELPDFLQQSGIQGLYICANKPFFELDWEVDLVVFGIGIYATAGFDARFWLNFGDSYGGAHLGGLAYADFELYANVLMVCEMCVGVLAELGFEAEYQWVPNTDFTISACGTVGFNVSFCGTDFNETAKLEVGWSSASSDVYYEATLGESCSGNASSDSGGCNHF